MTKQELHTCDVCGKEFKVPQESLMSLIGKKDGAVLFEMELCFGCYQSFVDWNTKGPVDRQ